MERQTRRPVAVRLFCRSCAQAGMFFRVPLPPPTAVRPPHRTENEARCVFKNAAVKQPSVLSLPFRTERFIPSAAAAVLPLRQKNRSCALGLAAASFAYCTIISTQSTTSSKTSSNLRYLFPAFRCARNIPCTR